MKRETDAMAAVADKETAASGKRKRRELLNAARLGVREAQYELGLMYAKGIGGAQDVKEAVSWVGQAAEKGLAAAQYLLATQCASGFAGTKDEVAAHGWFSKAAEQGHAKALYRLARMLETAQPQVALAQLRRAADLGLAEAQLALGKALRHGRGDLSGDPAGDDSAAVRWVRLAADQGLASAQHEFACIKADGLGCEADPDTARHWFRKAAAQDHAASVVALDSMDAAGGGRSPGTTVERAPPTVERRGDGRRWLAAVDPGDADGRYHLGLLFERGIEAPLQADKARHWYALAARQGDAGAQATLARLLEQAGDAEAALGFYRQAANQGECSAQAALGRLHSSRDGNPQEAFVGLLWYVRAADAGDPLALLTLSHLFGQGQDHVARHCLQGAAEQGVAQAQVMLGQLYERGIDRGDGGTSAMPTAAGMATGQATGHATGHATTVAIGRGSARATDHATPGVTATSTAARPDLRRAADWYRRAAEQGDAHGQCALGLCLLVGHGTERSASQARRWLEAAAEQGDARAQWNLGALLASGGDGVAQDLTQAFVWCRKSADQGYTAARATLGLLHARIGQPEQAVGLWTAAAEAGDAEAQYNLGVSLAKGDGCAADARAAFGWFALAAEQGVRQAQSRLGLMYASGDGVALDPVEAHKWFVVAARAGDAAAIANRQHSATRASPAQVDEGVRRAGAWAAARRSSNGSPTASTGR